MDFLTTTADQFVLLTPDDWAVLPLDTPPPIQRPANLPFTSTIVESWFNGNRLTALFTDTGNAAMNSDFTVQPSGTLTGSLPFVLDSYSQPLQSLYIVSTFTQSTGPVTITFGSNAIPLTPSIPSVWSYSAGGTCPIPDGTTTFTLTNPNAAQAIVQIRALQLIGLL